MAAEARRRHVRSSSNRALPFRGNDAGPGRSRVCARATAPGTLTVVGNSIFHVTFFENGDESWATGTLTGVATLTPTDPSGVSASGHFTAWFGGAQNNKNEVEHFTNTVHLKGSDGSRIAVHGSTHTSTNASGEVTVSFEKERATCG